VATTAVERRAYTPQEAAVALGLGESKMRELYTTGRLRCVRVGRRVLIPREAVDRFLAGQEAPVARDFGR
jgi:excisionase family DNA binding protein